MVNENKKKQFVDDIEFCEHDWEFAGEFPVSIEADVSRMSWQFECPHCGATTHEEHDMSYWDKRNW